MLQTSKQNTQKKKKLKKKSNFSQKGGKKNAKFGERLAQGAWRVSCSMVAANHENQFFSIGLRFGTYL